MTLEFFSFLHKLDLMNKYPILVLTAIFLLVGVLSADAQTRRPRTQAPTTTTTSTNTTVTVISNN